MRRIDGLLALLGLVALRLFGDTTIDGTHPYAYGANVGWLNARGDVDQGVVVGEAFCGGHLWSANCGWIGFGNGPTNGWHYGNATSNDWGVNHDGAGLLTGHAWGANVGWLTFEQAHGKPRVDLATGFLSGYVWGANVGWISLSNAQAVVRTTRFEPGGDTDGDGIPDWWERWRAGGLGVLHGGTADWDEDGVPDGVEAGADTDPMDEGDYLAITAFQPGTGVDWLAWRSRPTRLYRVEATNALPPGAVGPWAGSAAGLVGPFAASPASIVATNANATAQFYRVRAVPPLSE